ncbi:hypothetical protein N7462_001488 [Penicillium macrosclerotiorum]|uniref:uncharacterized protein n=1 Tax=Penicillium macrosclerotiorum TaxID=303699 RepID=UPI0025470DEF|nr:uncharacterized protein N7462_001488 [Penicillium macrosclerotiorum]KAJ5692065.1 hypothetical protein N7462_001488 [Penicillium macrosclerotiorum]
MECPVHQVKPFAPSLSSKDEIDPSRLVAIPQPPPQHYFGLLGHIPEVDPSFPLQSYWKMMDMYGPIFKLNLGTTAPRILIGNHELLSEMLDDDRFQKSPNRVQQAMRDFMGDGLFTARLEEENWWKAHRILVPAFGPIGLRKMFDDMLEVSSQLILKWDRFGPDYEIDSAEDFTRLTFDTIGVCGFGYRFNEFYSEQPHPFAQQLQEALLESGKRGNRPPFMNPFYYKSEQHRQENIAKMRELCDQVVQERIANPQPEARDVLNLMLNGVDPKSGEKLSVENVQFQMVTFLGAGHETTSASLGFTYYFLCNHPEKLVKAQQEVDEVVGTQILTADMLPRLVYLDACIKESLRVMSPINLFNRTAKRDTTLAGKYFIKKGQLVSGLMRHFHRDPKIWGEDADDFRPERMLNGGFEALPRNSWKAFGDGLRACIGSGFAVQEMLINMAMVLQRFHIEKADPEYVLQLKSTLSIKPLQFKMKVRRRPGRSILTGLPGSSDPAQAAPQRRGRPEKLQSSQKRTKQRVSLFFGGNSGTSESLAHSLVAAAVDFGIEIDTQSLDAATENLPTDRPCVIITPSYDGRPPDNARIFVAWIENLSARSKELPRGIKYAVFGLGNSDWASTFLRIPRLVDRLLTELGAERIVDPIFADVKKDLMGPWEEWSEQLCMTLSGATELHPGHSAVGVDVRLNDSNDVQVACGEKMVVGTVITNNLLADTSIGPAKHHVDIMLPSQYEYKSGDYLVIQGRNSDEIVNRVLTRFQLNKTDVMSIQGSKKDFLPSQPMAVEEFLHGKVELATPITKRQLATLASWAKEDNNDRKRLQEMQGAEQYQALLDKRYSVIDVLEEALELTLPFGVYLDLLVRSSPRQYSISTTPLDPRNNRHTQAGHNLVAGITFDLFKSPAMSGHGTFHGVASSYLATCKPGDHVLCSIRPTSVPFRLPADPETPIIMLAAGTGIAPMRAFIQERATIKNAGVRRLGPAILFFGCRHPDKDYIYKSELEKWEREGVVEVIPCFSRPSVKSERRYVPDALWHLRHRVWEMFQKDGRIYVCGSASRLGRSCSETWRRIWAEKTGKSETEAQKWLEKIKNNRYISDVY